MKRRTNRVYHDFGQKKEPESEINSPYDPPNYWEDDTEVPVLPEEQQINERLASMQIKPQRLNTDTQRLIDRIPGPQLPSTLGINGQSKEPVPEIPEERELAQAAVDEGNAGQFRTFEDTCPPPADIQYEVVDQGVSGPNFIRSSMYNIPFNDKLKSRSKLPLALYVRPFAEPDVPLADFTAFNGEEMPPRCHRCRAYMNPSMRFVSGGAKFVCNLCLFVNDTPAEYFQPTGSDGKRLDWDTRPELAFGTYDFAVVAPLSSESPGHGERQGYAPHPQRGSSTTSSTAGNRSNTATRSTTRVASTTGADLELEDGTLSEAHSSVYGIPASPEFRRVFVCECSRDAVQKGIVKLFTDSIRACLPYLASNERIAIMTFDSNIHMFRPSPNNGIQMLVEAADGPVIPPDVFMEPENPSLMKLLDDLPIYFDDTSNRSSCFGSVLDAIADIGLQTNEGSGIGNGSGGGRVSVMISTLPSWGPSLLQMRDNAIAGITPPDAPVHKELFEPTSVFYKTLSNKLVKSGWGCDVLAVPTTGYLDLANIGLIARTTGGRLLYYPRFIASRDSRRVIGDWLALATSPMQARNVSLRIRTSTGLQVESIYGCDSGKAVFMDSNSTAVATIVYDGALDPKLDAHFQAAVLYTTPSGEKRVRVINLLAGVTTKIKPVLKFVDTDVIMAVITRQALSQLGNHTTRELRRAVLDKIEHIFGAARLYAGQGMPLTQLLMPTNLRQLLMLGLALTKSICLGSRAFSSDARVVNAYYLSNAPVNELTLLLYPRIYDIGAVSENLATSRARFADLALGTRVYLIFDGQQMYIWLGETANPTVLTDLFGVSSIGYVSPWLDELPERDNPLSIQARELIASLCTRVSRSWLPVQIVREKLDGAEYQLRQLMTEDTINDSPSYINYVVRVHTLAKEYHEKEGWF